MNIHCDRGYQYVDEQICGRKEGETDCLLQARAVPMERSGGGCFECGSGS